MVQVFKLPFDCQAIFLSPHADFSDPSASLSNAARGTAPGGSEADGAGSGGVGVHSRATATQVAANTQVTITTRAPLHRRGRMI